MILVAAQPIIGEKDMETMRVPTIIGNTTEDEEPDIDTIYTYEDESPIMTPKQVLKTKKFWTELRESMGKCTNTHAVTRAVLLKRFNLTAAQIEEAMCIIKNAGGYCCDCEVQLNAETILGKKKYDEYFGW